jgi:hypothetical protein
METIHAAIVLPFFLIAAWGCKFVDSRRLSMVWVLLLVGGGGATVGNDAF